MEKVPEGLPESIMISADLELVTEKPVDADAPKDEEDGEPCIRSLSHIFNFTSQTANSLHMVRCETCGKEFRSEGGKAAHQEAKGH